MILKRTLNKMMPAEYPGSVQCLTQSRGQSMGVLLIEGHNPSSIQTHEKLQG
jgi:hypothetical protein